MTTHEEDPISSESHDDQFSDQSAARGPAETEPASKQRLRITFGKLGSQKYIGHLDLAKTWERILRRAAISLSYSNGFNARPKMQFAAALALGITSECEILDMWLDFPLALDGLAEWLMAVSPPGLPIFKVEEVPLKSPALPTLVESTLYTITPKEPIALDDLRERTAKFLAEPHIIRKHKDKSYDLRPLVLSLAVRETGQLLAQVVLGNQGTGRPDELVDVLGLGLCDIMRNAITLKQLP